MPPASENIKKQRKKSPGRLRVVLLSPVLFLKKTKSSLAAKANRGTFANLLMVCFIMFCSIGTGMIFMPAGWVVAGVCCGLFALLLGLG
jgi:hypothetical protein